jgi:hypothetical protein
MAETVGQIDIFEVLAAAAADEQNSHIQRHGIPPAVSRNAAVEHPCSGGVLLSVTFGLSEPYPGNGRTCHM